MYNSGSLFIINSYKLIKSTLILVFCLILIGCATPTPYGPMTKSFGSGSGGYTDSRLDANTVRVSFKSNPYNSSDKIQDYFLYRSAELTLEYGYDYFVVLNNKFNQKYKTISTPGEYKTTTVYKDEHEHEHPSYFKHASPQTNTHTTYTPATTEVVEAYRLVTGTIKMFNGQKPVGNTDAYDAKEIKKFLGPSILTKHNS